MAETWSHMHSDALEERTKIGQPRVCTKEMLQYLVKIEMEYRMLAKLPLTKGKPTQIRASCNQWCSYPFHMPSLRPFNPAGVIFTPKRRSPTICNHSFPRDPV